MASEPSTENKQADPEREARLAWYSELLAKPKKGKAKDKGKKPEPTETSRLGKDEQLDINDPLQKLEAQLMFLERIGRQLG